MAPVRQQHIDPAPKSTTTSVGTELVTQLQSEKDEMRGPARTRVNALLISRSEKKNTTINRKFTES